MAQIYGVLKARIVADPWLQPTPQRNSTERQYHVRATLQTTAADGTAQTWDSATNVGTSRATDLLVYLLGSDFAHPVLAQLQNAPEGFQDLTGTDALPALDFLRSDILAHTGPWQQTTPLDGSTTVEPVATILRLLGDAKANDGTVYLFGHRYADGSLGIHDIHMNQGSTGHYTDAGRSPNEHNAIWQDGGLLVDLGQAQWAFFFSAFTQQGVPTDGNGNPTPGAHTITEQDEGSLES